MERKVLAACLYDRNNYLELSPYLEENDFSDKGNIIYKAIEDYYERDPAAADVDVDLLKAKISREYPKHAKKFHAVIDELEISSFPNLIGELIKFKKHTVSMKLSNELLNGSESRVKELMEEWETLDAGEIGTADTDTDEDIFYQTDLSEYVEQHEDKTERIALYPKSLNNSINGGVLPGHHVVLFAPPECGKTMFAISMAAGMLRAGHRVLYFTNEEPAFNVVVRFLASMTNKSMDWAEANLSRAEKLARSKGYENLIVKGAAPGTPQEICGLIEKYEPKIVFIDQMRLLQIPGQEIGTVLHIETAANMMRTIGKKYGIVPVSLTQAGESAHNKPVLDMGDTYMSNTGVPGSADLMIGLGVNDDYEYAGQRIVSLCKNKINGNHCYFMVNVDTAKNRVRSIK